MILDDQTQLLVKNFGFDSSINSPKFSQKPVNTHVFFKFVAAFFIQTIKLEGDFTRTT